MTIKAYDDVGAPLENFAWTYEAGQLLTMPTTVELRNEGPGPASPVPIIIQTEHLTESDVWLSYGVPPQDESWLKAAILSSDWPLRLPEISKFPFWPGR